MTVPNQIAAHIAAQLERKRSDMQALHDIIRGVMPGCRLWFLDGKDENGRTISNPNVGYGVQAMTYADREVHQVQDAEQHQRPGS